MLNGLSKKPDFFQGLLCIALGLMMLFYAFGFMQKAITLIIVLSALVLISVGCVKVGLYEKCMKMLNKQIRKE